jgi:hypothetical protein
MPWGLHWLHPVQSHVSALQEGTEPPPPLPTAKTAEEARNPTPRKRRKRKRGGRVSLRMDAVVYSTTIVPVA